MIGRARADLKNKLLSYFDNHLFLNKDFNIEDTTIIIGSHRSGTTWLMELISTLPGYITLFEPFHPEWFPESKVFLPQPNKNHDYIHPYIEKTLSGKIHVNIPKYKLNISNLHKRLMGDRLLVKFVRINNMINYIAEEFPVMACLYIIRNPFSVINSQLRTRIFPELYTHVRKQSTNKSLASILTSIWYHDQIEPLKSSSDKIYKLKYEDLLTRPNEVMQPFLKKIGHEEKISNILDNISIPSKLTLRSGYNARARIDNSILKKWQEELSSEQINEIKTTLEHYNFNYNELKFDYHL